MGNVGDGSDVVSGGGDARSRGRGWLVVLGNSCGVYGL